MAHVRNNLLTLGISGAVGDEIVFRQLRGKTIVAKRGKPPVKQSALQRENRNRFRDAASYARLAMENPEKKAYYWRKAKKLKLPNAYTAAIADYMRTGEIKAIDTKQYKGKPGNVVGIKTFKKDFAVQNVSVTLRDEHGNSIESGFATKKEGNLFIYKGATTLPQGSLIIMRVTITDRMIDIVRKDIEIRI